MEGMSKRHPASQHPLECVIWDDSTSHQGWADQDDLEERDQPFKAIVTVGFVVRESEASLFLTDSVGTFNDARDAIRIPKRAVLKRRKLTGIRALRALFDRYAPS